MEININMECSEEILIGKARALDIPIDAIKAFVERFNSEIPGLAQCEVVTADINDLVRNADIIELRWKANENSGVFTYDFMKAEFNVS